MEFLTLIIFGIVAGLLSRIFGLGGGFLIVPLLYKLLPHNSYSMQIAIATSLSVIITNSIFATYRAYKNNSIIWSFIFPIFYYIGCGSIIGAYITSLLPSIIIHYIYIVYMLIIIFSSLYKKDFIIKKDKVTPLAIKQNIIYGILIGSIASTFGIGGGIIIVPLMRKLGLSMKHSSAIGNTLSLPVALVGAISYAFIGANLNLQLGYKYLGLIYLPALFILSITGLIGITIGGFFVKHINDRAHALGFIISLIISLIIMII